ncbi:MAG: ferritin-like domain-containing protein [Streptosporangiaceae bacterium]|jgi:hypothetical protein
MTSAVTALQVALAAENAAIYGYGVAGAYLSGSAQTEATSDWHAHLLARDTLQSMISGLGATPVAAESAYQMPFTVDDVSSAAKLAAYLEDGVASGYLGVVAVADESLRSFGARAMLDPALRAARWRGSTVAFPGF